MNSQNERHATLQPDDKLSQFQIVRRLSAGTHAVSWLGRDPVLRRDVLIKQILTENASEAFRQHFDEHVRSLRPISDQSPHLPGIIEGIHDTRGTFLVRQYVPGKSLADATAQRDEPASARGALHVLTGLGQALETIHTADLRHGNIKPANVLLARDGSIQLADTGVARLAAEEQALSLEAARYLAPELCRGEEADGRADLYALGFLLYELLAGPRGFERAFQSVLRDQRQQAMRWIKWHTNPRLTAPPLRELNPTVPETLSALIERLMEKDPAKRVPSASDLNHAIERHFSKRAEEAPEPTAAAYADTDPKALPDSEPSGPTADEPAPNTWRGWIAGGALAASLAVAGVLGYTLLEQNGQQRIHQAQALLEEAQSHYGTGDFTKARDQHQQVLKQLPADHALHGEARAGLLAAKVQLALEDDAYQQARQTLTELEQLDAASAQRLRRLRERVDSAASFAEAVQRVEAEIEAGNFDEARNRIAQWRELSLAADERQTLEQLHRRTTAMQRQQQAERAIAEAREYATQGNRQQALEHLREARDRYDTASLREAIDRIERQREVDQLTAQARQAQDTDNHERAVSLYKEAVERMETEALKQKLRSAQAQAAIARGRRLARADNRIAAREAFNEALGYVEKDSRPHQTAQRELRELEVATERTSLVQMGDKALAEEQYDVAVRQYERAVELEEGDDDRNVRGKLRRARLQHLLEQGDRALHEGAYDRAEDLYQQAQAMEPDKEKVKQGLARAQDHLAYREHLMAGDRHREAGRYVEAKRAYSRARDVLETREAKQRLDDAEYQQLLVQAEDYIERGEWEPARATLLTIQNRLRDSERVRQLLQEVRDGRDQNQTTS